MRLRRLELEASRGRDGAAAASPAVSAATAQLATASFRRERQELDAKSLTAMAPQLATALSQAAALAPSVARRIGSSVAALERARGPESVLRALATPSLNAQHPERGARRWAPIFIDTETTGLHGVGVMAWVVGILWQRPCNCRSERRSVEALPGDPWDRVADATHGAVWVLDQWILEHPRGEHALLTDLLACLDGIQASNAAPKLGPLGSSCVGGLQQDESPGETMLVSYNGRGFDLPLLSRRLKFNGISRPLLLGHDEPLHHDLLPLARALWSGRGSDCRLSTLEAVVLDAPRVGDVAGSEIPSIYWDYVGARAEAREQAILRVAAVVQHNAVDLLGLAALTMRAAEVVHGSMDTPAEFGQDAARRVARLMARRSPFSACTYEVAAAYVRCHPFCSDGLRLLARVARLQQRSSAEILELRRRSAARSALLRKTVPVAPAYSQQDATGKSQGSGVHSVRAGVLAHTGAKVGRAMVKVANPKVTETKVTETKVTETKVTETKVTETKVTAPRREDVLTYRLWSRHDRLAARLGRS